MAETMLNYLEQQAVRWLVNRGYLVIKQPFIGMCLGGANADHVTVRCGLRQARDADYASGADPIFDHELLAETCG